MHKITAIIPCKNEAHNIEAVLESVKWCDEILVVDSFSSDNTIELAKKYTSRIIESEYKVKYSNYYSATRYHMMPIGFTE